MENEYLPAPTADITTPAPVATAPIVGAVEPVESNEPSGFQLVAVSGNFPMVSSKPTLVPKTFAQSIAIDSTKAALYIYDFVRNIWDTISAGGATIYAGRVVSSAAATFFPSGWSFAHTGTGIYTLTHNLGHKNYALTITPDASGEAFCIFGYAVLDNNSVQVWFNAPDASFAFQNQDFSFILTTTANP